MQNSRWRRAGNLNAKTADIHIKIFGTLKLSFHSLEKYLHCRLYFQRFNINFLQQWRFPFKPFSGDEEDETQQGREGLLENKFSEGDDTSFDSLPLLPKPPTEDKTPETGKQGNIFLYLTTCWFYQVLIKANDRFQNTISVGSL